ncbi:hypothetical protein PLICRDRAFT_481591 [Plicaturopsis crispa FD-325 SS-3]|nr:hypothetical protein PLICRDRAFT_481591 [Plicaturopsis crispa FD-325 SS-3]
MSHTPMQPSPSKDITPGGIDKRELFWVHHYTWLAQCGYELRPRYSPDWIPSWLGKNKLLDFFEDGQSISTASICDATRVTSTGKTFVSLKKIRKSVHPYEAEIGQFLSSDPLSQDPTNHCVPFLDVLQVPDDDDILIIVMPLLRDYDNPRFDTIGEAVDFLTQVIEGVHFMHKHHVAHRDLKYNNVMMDATPLYPIPYHPYDTAMRRDYTGLAKHYTRTQRPVKYYIIDFGISRRYNPADGPPLEYPIWGGDKTVPEFQTSLDACDPFPTDVYYLGNMIRDEFINKRYGFEFMRPLVADMVAVDPAKRPRMDEVVARFEAIRRSLSWWKLRGRVANRDDSALAAPYRMAAHWTRRVSYIIQRIPSVPSVRVR